MVFPSYILSNVVDNSDLVMERGWREMVPTCPRCGSSNTKFCYYNNYSLTQPRYFCKGCRRYWTKGGSLRNVPVGGGCRKSRRFRSSSSALRLTPSSNHHHGISSRNNTMFGSQQQHHHHHNINNNNQDHLGGHGNININNNNSNNNNNNNMGDSTPSPMNSEAPTIDLAVVYANFLTQKPENSNDVLPSGGYNNSNPPLVELSNIPDATIIAPTSQVLLQVQLEHPNFSQPLPILPELMMNNNHHDHQNQVVFVTEFSRSIHHQHDELGLPPLPGGDSLLLQDHHHQQGIPWEASNLNHHHHHNQDDGNINDDLESDSQFSNLFNNGSWSPLDLPGFETPSSSSKL